MKKIIAMLLALVMVLGLAACATKTEPAQPEETTPAETMEMLLDLELPFVESI